LAWLKIATTVLLGLPWLLAQGLYLPVAGPLIGAVGGIAELVSRSRWQADDRQRLEEELARQLPREVPEGGRSEALARVEALRAERQAALPGYGLKLAIGLLNLAAGLAAAGIGVAWLLRRRLGRPRLWLGLLDGAVAALGGLAASLLLATGEGGSPGFKLDGLLFAAGLVAAGGWLFFGEALEERFIHGVD
jgi:hypothetical protein